MPECLAEQPWVGECIAARRKQHVNHELNLSSTVGDAGNVHILRDGGIKSSRHNHKELPHRNHSSLLKRPTGLNY